MDDGSAAIFTELVRNASGKLLLLGSHVSCRWRFHARRGSPDISGLRHVWAAASPAHSAGGILASHLVANQSSFSIVENFLSTQAFCRQAYNGERQTVVPGFLSYRLEGRTRDRPGPDSIHLHCSGLSPSNGCELLGWNAAGRWTPVSQRELTQRNSRIHGQGNGQPQSAGWVESVGYAVMAAALGTGAIQESCSSRAFVHRSACGKPRRADGCGGAFTSFIIDT